MSKELNPKSPVLIVDDDEHFLNSMKVTLNTQGVTNVECCSNPLDVIRKLAEKKYSLIYLDILMPGKRGDDLLPEILLKYPDIRVIMLTNYDEVETAVKCMKLGASEYFLKPGLKPK